MAPKSPQKSAKEHGESAAKPKPLVETCPSFSRGHLPHAEDVERLRNLSAPHVDSFNYFLDVGLEKGIQDIEPVEIDIVDPQKLRTSQVVLSELTSVQFWVEIVKIGAPVKKTSGSSNRLLPRECRELGFTYAGEMTGSFCYRIIQRRNGVKMEGHPVRIPKQFGALPLMVMSKACHLKGKTPAELAKLKEEHTEFGGYFIVNGIERCIRLLQIPRRNHPMAIKRSNYQKRGPTFTDLGVATRSSRHTGDQSSITNTVHYLTTGGSSMRFVARKQEFLIPVVLIMRALSGSELSDAGADAAAGGVSMGVTDEELYRRIVQGDEENTFLRARAELLLQDARARFGNLNTPEECLSYIGERFRPLSMKSETSTNIEIAHFMIRRYVLIHLKSYRDKLECLLLMMRKLYAFAVGECGVDNSDSLQNQEILLPGHLISAFIKEKFEELLQGVRLGLLIEARKDAAKVLASWQDSKFWLKLVERYASSSSGGIGKKFAHLLSTGNIVSTTGLDLMQVSGYTIVAEKLNFLRYVAHFRSVHRGQFFMEMKTTAVRKLLPDQWGFLCPVHTPDGGPCGLLSHLALNCSILSHPAMTGKEKQAMIDLLFSFGVVPVGAGSDVRDGRASSSHLNLPVCLDGRVVGGAAPGLCKTIVSHLRRLKVASSAKVPCTLEVALITGGKTSTLFPGLFLFSDSARLVRPVLQRASGKVEWIGPKEQPFMDIACLDEDVKPGITTHQELDPTNMLSLIASLTPFSEYNQSCRIMYQCQMGKQTMGTPCHSLPYRTDNKLYRLQTPQAPLVQTARHGEFKMDDYPNGTNAVVAVLSYTGYDMEDAMIINKGSYERGLCHASVYKTLEIDLEDEAKKSGASGQGKDARLKFSNRGKGGKPLHDDLDDDGLARVGTYLEEGDPLYCIVDEVTGKDKVGKHKDSEKAYVQAVRALGADSGSPDDCKVSITLRYPRKPIIGDKFASRHGQKGVLSILWPHQDMPFSESGISPDIIINPHAFPSRMTIGMLLESMAGKAGSMHGMYQDATPFKFHESADKVALDYFGEQLQAAGYSYYGSEPLYSGVSGCLMHADLYIGVVYYQRLRHMVADKSQVRATGGVNQLTRQPIKGRKKGGGIRLGEMERDSLLSHGAAYILLDRLLNCSDRHVAYACTRCGDLLSPTTERVVVLSSGQNSGEAIQKAKIRLFCRNPMCKNVLHREEGGSDEAIEPIIIPYVFRYLVNELAGMNVRISMNFKA